MFFYPEAWKEKPKNFFCIAISGLCPLGTNKSTGDQSTLSHQGLAADRDRQKYAVHWRPNVPVSWWSLLYFMADNCLASTILTQSGKWIYYSHLQVFSWMALIRDFVYHCVLLLLLLLLLLLEHLVSVRRVNLLQETLDFLWLVDDKEYTQSLPSPPKCTTQGFPRFSTIDIKFTFLHCMF